VGHSRKAIAAAAVLAVGLATAGCSNSGSDGSDELRVMLWGNDADISSIQDAAAGFIEANPDIKVKFETGDCGVDYAACKTLVAGRNMPDVFVMGSWNYFQAASDGILKDLDGYFDESGLDLGKFTPSVIGALKSPVDGKTYGLPMGFNVQSLFYNKAMFEAAGLEEPPADGSYTYDDLRDWAKKLTLDANGNNAESADFDPDNIVQYGYFNFSAATPAIEPGYGPVLAAHGGGIISGPARNECVADSDGTIEAFQLIQDMMWKDHSTITPQLQQEESGPSRWVRGQVAMQQGSHEQVIAVQQQNPELSYNMAALPAGSAGNASMMQIHVWSMYKESKNQEAAYKFLEYMGTEGTGKQMGLIPAWDDRAMGPDFAQAPNEPSNLIAAQIEPAAWPLTFTNTDPSSVWAAVTSQDGVGPAIDDITNNRKSAAEALGGICASTVDPILEASGS
jgi:multiple sugar transport system substrate-binding protein